MKNLSEKSEQKIKEEISVQIEYNKNERKNRDERYDAASALQRKTLENLLQQVKSFFVAVAIVLLIISKKSGNNTALFPLLRSIMLCWQL